MNLNYCLLIATCQLILSCKPVEPTSERYTLMHHQEYEILGFGSEEDFNQYKDCKANGFIYNRLAYPEMGQCTRIPIAKNFECTPYSIQKALEKSGTALTIKQNGSKIFFDDFVDFEIDQCGELESQPFIILIKKDYKEDFVDSFEIKTICNNSRETCYP